MERHIEPEAGGKHVRGTVHVPKGRAGGERGRVGLTANRLKETLS